ncbi:insulinase family protein [Salibacteraceae bacterium]|nr:insulinase family protein [Salibacteraceae bacterium]MDB9709270.1 insulinase family protein [Salibacteraceae bacterium]MDC1305130.1 insulinase family protein [Salibacteraceae bacterium]
MEFDIIRLTNGLRVLHFEDKNIMTVHCGFIINAGSRDELSTENGIAHLIEHCLFKGTERRKAFHILTRLDSVGGEVNAYTTKEETSIYASALKEHFNRAAELLVDITFSSIFPEKEIEKEKSVIIDEINSYKDNPDEMLMDEFEERLFPDHALGRSILGTADLVNGFTREDILRFVERNYSTDQIVFTCVGNVSLKKIETFCNNVLEKLPTSTSNRTNRTIPESTMFRESKKTSVHQVHSLLGCKTIGFDDDRRRAMVLMNNILGGPALNSRLNLNIRERFGYCYYIESSYAPYADTGVFQIYFGTDKRHERKVAKLIVKELKSLTDVSLSDRVLSVSKKQLIGQIALSQENRANLMLSLGKALLQFDKVDQFEEIQEQVHEITADEIQVLAAETFDDNSLASLSYVPE